MYRYAASTLKPAKGKRAQLFGSGAIMSEVLKARDLLEERGVATDIWSVTSYNELNREALRCERDNLLQRGGDKTVPMYSQLLADEAGVFVAATDYMKALPLSIARGYLAAMLPSAPTAMA